MPGLAKRRNEMNCSDMNSNGNEERSVEKKWLGTEEIRVGKTRKRYGVN